MVDVVDTVTIRLIEPVLSPFHVAVESERSIHSEFAIAAPAVASYRREITPAFVAVVLFKMPCAKDVTRYVPAVRDTEAPVLNQVLSAVMLVNEDALLVPLFAPTQFPVGKSSASIARKVTAVLAELEARKVRAPVEVISAGKPELPAVLPMTESPALSLNMAFVISAFGTMPAVS